MFGISLTSFPSIGSIGHIKGVNTKYLIIIIAVLVALFIVYRFFVLKEGWSPNREGESNSSANANKSATIMFFFANWCPHCKTAKPIWEDIKAQWDGVKTPNGYSIVFTEYNCTDINPETQKLMDKYGVGGFPTIKLIKDNQVIDFDANPSKTALNEFIKTNL